jgi:UDP-N-acetylglucosamine:LPS N-acetylglucosamine transferase
MPALMAACDALVENAGGLTSLEAMRAGLPVVSFKPIAGHGRDNTAAMDAAGVARLADDSTALVTALATLTRGGTDRDVQVGRAHAMFRCDPEEAIVEAAGLSPLPRLRSGHTPA